MSVMVVSKRGDPRRWRAHEDRASLILAARREHRRLVASRTRVSPSATGGETRPGSLAERRRDSSEVSRLRRLLQNSRPNPALMRYLDARVAAVRGDNETARSLLSDAVSLGAQAEELVMDGDAAASMEPEFAVLRGSAMFRTAIGRW